MSLTIIALIVLVGLLLISLEVFLVPGTTIVGVFGVVVVGIGVYYGYIEGGAGVGTGILVGAAVLVGLLTSFGLKRMENSKFNVKTVIDSSVGKYDYSKFEVGDEGVTLSALRPEGRALIRDEKVEVYSQGFYIDNDTTVVIIKIENNKIFVEPKS